MKYFILLIISMAFINCSSDVLNYSEWESIIKIHLEKYPRMQAADVYKLIYQGVMGPGHLGADVSKITESLEYEMSKIEADPKAPLIENISPDSTFIRINLYRCKSENYSINKLARLIPESSEIEPAAREHFIRLWQELVKKVENGTFGLYPEKFSEFNQYIIENNFPVIHHSEEYIKYYSPAYRVVSLKAWRKAQSDFKNDN